VTGALGAVAALGALALAARASHAGGTARTHVASAPPLSAPRSFVRALDLGLSPGVVGPASGPPQAQTSGS
jgi:hypothetical protein